MGGMLRVFSVTAAILACQRYGVAQWRNVADEGAL